MIGSSRESLKSLQQLVAARSGEPSFASASADLLNASALLASDKSLRVALVDSGQSPAAREAIVREVFGSRLGAMSVDILAAAAGTRWSSDNDVVEAIEAIAALIVFADADANKTLDRVEEEIFLFGRAVDANPDLQMALTNPALSGAAKSAVVHDVLAGRATAGAAQLLEYLAANLRGHRVDDAVKVLSNIAAEQRNRLVAEVRVVAPLVADQATRLSAVLGRIAGRSVSLNVVIDPSVVGGVSVRLGDDVIDGSIRTRLEQARRTIVA